MVASSTEGAMVTKRSIIDSLRDKGRQKSEYTNMYSMTDMSLWQYISIHVLPCELSGLCADESVSGFLQECTNHLRMMMTVISKTPVQEIWPVTGQTAVLFILDMVFPCTGNIAQQNESKLYSPVFRWHLNRPWWCLTQPSCMHQTLQLQAAGCTRWRRWAGSSWRSVPILSSPPLQTQKQTHRGFGMTWFRNKKCVISLWMCASSYRWSSCWWWCVEPGTPWVSGLDVR